MKHNPEPYWRQHHPTETIGAIGMIVGIPAIFCGIALLCGASIGVIVLLAGIGLILGRPT